jgi:predicted nucleic-acid-binding Zn-ribbon protein
VRLAFTLSALALGGALCIGAVRRYGFLLGRAECLGAQSSCGKCRAYGVLKVTAAGVSEATPSPLAVEDNSWIRVQCKKCGHEWRMDNH